MFSPLGVASAAAAAGVSMYNKHWTKKHGQSIKNVLGSEAATSSGAPHESMSGNKRSAQSKLPYKQKKPRTGGPPTRRNIHDDPYNRPATLPARPPKMSVSFLRPRRLASKRKAVSLPKMSSQYRFQHHQNVVQATVHKALWFGGSSLGSGEDACKVLADAMICHYLRRLGDSRSSRTTANLGDSTFQNAALWHFMDITFGTVGQEQISTTLFETDSADDASKGLTLSNANIDTLVPRLASKLEKMYLNSGMVPIRVSIRKKEWFGVINPATAAAEETDTRQILDDTDAYRNQFTISVSGLFKIHNVTLPPDEGKDKHAINAQPIDGKLYNFRNRVPVFHPSYLAGFSSTVGQISNLANDPVATGITMTSYETGVNYDALNSGTANPIELESPPLRPGTVFKNSTSSEKVYMAPGALKFRKTYFAMAGSLMTIFKRILPIPFNVQNTSGTASSIPPGGDSFLVCLKPTVKISNTEVVTLDTQHSHMFKAHCKKAKMLLLPTKQFLE